MSLDSLITKDICQGVITSGERIKISYLCARHNSTPPPIREALNRLSATGLIDYKKNFGFSVKHISKNEFNDIYELRKATIPPHLKKAMSNKSVAWYQDIASKMFLISHFNKPTKNYSVDEFTYWEDINSQFYTCIFQNAQSHPMMKVYTLLDSLSKPYRFALMSNLSNEKLNSFYKTSHTSVENLYNMVYNDKYDEAAQMIINILDNTIAFSENAFI